jgi:hypothetical protein
VVVQPEVGALSPTADQKHDKYPYRGFSSTGANAIMFTLCSSTSHDVEFLNFLHKYMLDSVHPSGAIKIEDILEVGRVHRQL